MADGSFEVYTRGDKVVLVIRGYYSTDRSIASASEVLERLSDLGRGEFIVDFTEAGGFDREGRVHWQGRLQELRPYVETLSIISGPPLMRMAAAAVCLYAGVKLRTLNSIDEAFAGDSSKRTG